MICSKTIMRHITLVVTLCIYFSCTPYKPVPKYYLDYKGDTIPQVDSVQLANYIQEQGDSFHLVYCYGGGCSMCESMLPQVLSFSKKQNIPMSVMIVERAADSLLVTICMNELYQLDSTINIIILSDSLYDAAYRYQRPQTERLSPFITYGANGEGDCNKYDRFLEKCVPNYSSYWHPRILLYHCRKGVVYDAVNSNGPAFSDIEKNEILNIIDNSN